MVCDLCFVVDSWMNACRIARLECAPFRLVSENLESLLVDWKRKTTSRCNYRS